MSWRLLFLLFIFGGAMWPAVAKTPDLEDFTYEQHPGAQLPINLPLRDEAGHSMTLAQLGGVVPLIFVLGYYHCPALCGLVRDDLFAALSSSGLVAGKDYQLALLSIDPTETADDANQAKNADLVRYNLPGVGQAWHYLTGDPDSIQAFARAVGFRNRFDPLQKQFVHPSGIVFASPAGVVSSYRLGLGYDPTDLRGGVARARLGVVARASLPVVLLCFHFDPATGRYSLAIMRLLQLTAILTVLTVAATIGLAFRRERRAR